MKANELMIGDWVWYNNQPHQIRELGIFGENRDGDDYPAVCVGKPNGVGLILERNDIEPIPLTAEILEKNGWKNISDHTLKGCETFKLHYEQKGFDYYITIKLRDYFKLESYDDRFYTLCEMEFGCRYVHQLQHALRLCGIDKNIVL